VRLFGGHALDDLRAATAIDLGYLADEVVALSEATDDPRYAEGVAAYEEARDALDRMREPEDAIGVCRAIGRGRLAMAHIRARREGAPLPATEQPCFFDPGHGPATQVVVWTPPGLDGRPVPVCEQDAAFVLADVQPDPREVVAGGDAVPFWRAPGHFAFWFQGYFGHGDGCLPVRMLAGLPLGGRFAEPE
jgi:hypothetical protein